MCFKKKGFMEVLIHCFNNFINSAEAKVRINHSDVWFPDLFSFCFTFFKNDGLRGHFFNLVGFIICQIKSKTLNIIILYAYINSRITDVFLCFLVLDCIGHRDGAFTGVNVSTESRPALWGRPALRPVSAVIDSCLETCQLSPSLVFNPCHFNVTSHPWGSSFDSSQLSRCLVQRL